MSRLAWVLLVVCAGSAPAQAWEADTTHAGLTEQAALHSNLHAVLAQRFGLELGLYQPLAVPKQGAPALFGRLQKIAPSSGLTPDARGRQSALAWLLAGAVLEDVPADRGAHHFYDPVRKRGLRRSARSLELLVFRAGSGDGQAAPDWILDESNDLSLKKFWGELEQAAVAQTREERARHLAFALLTAGAIVHVLEDVGSPSRARNDWHEHTQRLGGGAADRGSRFERIAALAYGRLGIPAPARVERRARVRDYFTSADGRGLADWAAKTWWSSGTLPHSNIAPEGMPEGTREIEQDGVCKAVVRVEDGMQTYSIPDECAGEQLAVILPRVAGYAQGLLEWLFRGELRVEVEGGVVTVTAPLALGPGELKVFVQGEDGMRRELAAARLDKPVANGSPLATFQLGDASRARVVAVFRGVDGAGEELIAVGRRAE